MTIQNINVETTIEQVKALIAEEKDLSSGPGTAR